MLPRRPYRPVPVRLLNAVGRASESVGYRPVSLVADDLIAAARSRTGLHDFGDESFREPLELIVQSLDEVPTTLFGRLIQRLSLITRLSLRLELQAAITAEPGIVAQPIERPVFIIGLPRSGTTMLHRLLSMDPSNRVPRTWEIEQPLPPPERETYETDPRIAQWDRKLSWFHWCAPEFRQIHDLAAELPEECLGLLAHEFTSVLFLVRQAMPRYREWLGDQDLRAAYRGHKRWLQVLQWRYRADRWVLKAPMHLMGLDALLDVYPDALVVQTHRNPLQVVPSTASLMVTARDVFQEDVSPAEIGEGVAGDLLDWLDHAAETRARLQADPKRHTTFVDTRFSETMADPLGTVRRIYEAFDLPLSDEAVRRMTVWLEENRRHKHGRHTYTLGQFGLDEAVLRERYRPYCERHGLVGEPTTDR